MGILEIAGCLKHGNMIWEAIQKAKVIKKDLDVIWLDLANTYGLVPHQMIHLSLQMYHVPAETSGMLGAYFDGFYVRFTIKDFTTNRTLRLELRWDEQSHQYFLFYQCSCFLKRQRANQILLNLVEAVKCHQ